MISRRSTSMRESSGMTSEGRWCSRFYKTGRVRILTDSSGIYQNHFQLRFLEYWRLVISWELNPLASPRLFTHHTGHYLPYPGDANWADTNRDGVHA